MSDENGTVVEETAVSSKWKKWWPVIQKVISGVVISGVGFLCAWLFNSVVELRENMATLNESIQLIDAQKQTDRDQWRSMSRLDNRIRKSEIETEVNRRVQQTLIDIMVVRSADEEPVIAPEDKPIKKIIEAPPSLRQSKELLEKINRMQKPDDVDDYIQREQTVAPQQKK